MANGETYILRQGEATVDDLADGADVLKTGAAAVSDLSDGSTILIAGSATPEDIDHTPAAYDANGAIAVEAGVAVITKATAAAMTLADPTDVTDDGKRLTIIAGTAQAHTVGANFNGSAGSAAFSAVGDTLELVAYGGDWLVVNTEGVTIT
jgi:hypothetical protein